MPLTTRDKAATAAALGLVTRDPKPELVAPQPDTLGPTDQEGAAIQTKESETSTGAAFAASFRVDNTAYNLYERATSPRFTYDRSFDGSEHLKTPEVSERVSKLTLADQEDLFEELGGTYNQDHFDFLLNRFEKKQEDELKIIDAGARGMVARLGANIFDPVDLVVTGAAAVTTGGPGAVAYKGTRLGRIARGAALAGTANAAVEGVVSEDNPFRDETDVMFAALAGIVLGGGLSSLTRGENIRLENTANRHADEVLRNAVPDSAGSSRRVLDGQDQEAAGNLAPESEEFFDEIFGDVDAPEFVGAFNAVDAVMTNLRGKVANGEPETRKIFAGMLEGGFLKDKSQVRRNTAEGRADAIERAMFTKALRGTDQHFKSWAAERNIGRIQADVGIEAGERFYSEVSDALRGIDDGVSAQAKAAAKEMRTALDEMWDLAQRAGVKGFEGEPLKNFMPRIYNMPEFNRKVNEYGEETIRSFFKEAIIRGMGDDVDDALANAFAKGMVRTLRRTSSGIDQSLAHGIPLDDMDRLRELLTDGLSGDDFARASNDVDEIAAAVEGFKARRNADAGKVNSAKRRVRLDEGFKDFVKAKDGTVKELRFKDLLANDSRAVVGRYIQVLSGHIGMAKELGITSKADFDKVLRGATSKAEARGVDPVKMKREMEALQRGYDLIIGRSVENDPNSFGSRLSRSIRDVNFARSSGSFGLAQLAEYGNLMATAVGRSFGTHIPEFRNLARRAADGQLDNKVARQLEEWFGPGTDFMRHPAIRGFDEFGEGFDNSTKGDRFLNKLDAPLQVTKRAASVLSLMGPIVTRMEKQAGIAHVLEFSDLARKGITKLGDAKAARWRGAGLSDEMQTAILKEMNKHAEWSPDGRLVDLHTKKWDFETADAMGQATRRQASLTIQRNDISDIPEAMRGPIGRLVFQFKSFMFGSITKQLERGVHYRDIETFVAFTSSVFVASLAYVGQTILETLTAPEEMKKKLTPEMIIGAGFSRAGWTALLVPFAATASDLMGYEDMFNHRFSGLQASLLSADQNPTSSAIGTILGVATSPLDLLDEEATFSPGKEAAKAMTLLPFNRVLGVKNAIHALEGKE